MRPAPRPKPLRFELFTTPLLIALLGLSVGMRGLQAQGSASLYWGLAGGALLALATFMLARSLRR